MEEIKLDAIEYSLPLLFSSRCSIQLTFVDVLIKRRKKNKKKSMTEERGREEDDKM